MIKITMTKKQTETLVRWSQNNTIKEIAQQMGVSYNTIKERIAVIKRLYPMPFENARGIKNSLKESKKSILDPLSWDDTGDKNKENNNSLIKHVKLYRDYSYDEE